MNYFPADIGYGLLGFAGFEGLRIYQRLWGKMDIVPANRPIIYVLILVALGAFSGGLAHILAKGQAITAIFIGFSVPTNARGILGLKAERTKRGDAPSRQQVGKRRKRREANAPVLEAVETDDIVIESALMEPERVSSVADVVKMYFDVYS